MWWQIILILFVASAIGAIFKLLHLFGFENWSWWIIAIPAALPLSPLILVGIFIWLASRKTF
jgi:hypothetical protein